MRKNANLRGRKVNQIELDFQAQKHLLVASDIHNSEQALEGLAELAKHPNCLAFLYAGDLNVENYFIGEILRYRSFVFLPVLGNCDNPWAFADVNVPTPPYYRTASYCNATGKLNIYMSHGHLYPYPTEEMVGEKTFNLIINGHSHVGLLQQEDNTIIFNPGSPSQPRGNCIPSYGVILIPPSGAFTVQLRKFGSNALLSQKTVSLN